MGVFGVQLIVTMVTASFLHKLSPYYSFGRWMATSRLTHYLTPSDEELGRLVPSSGKRSARSRGWKQLDGTQTLPKSAAIQLHSVPVMPAFLKTCHYYDELCWMLDFALAGVAVFAATALYYYLRPSAVATEYNLSSIWVIAMGCVAYVVLASLARVYFSFTPEVDRARSILIVFTAIFFVCALGVLLVDERILDFKLERTYDNITRTLGTVFATVAAESEGGVSFVPKWAFKFSLAFLAALLSFVQIFPGFQFAEVHFSAIQQARNAIVWKALLHLAYVSPMFSLALWVKPLRRDAVSTEDYFLVWDREVSYDGLRFTVLVFVCLLRIFLYSSYMQTYLSRPKLTLDQWKKESGRTTVSEVRKMVSSISSFYCAMAVEYIAPTLILLSLTILQYLSSGHYLAGSADPTSSLEPDEDANPFKASGFGLGIFHGCFSFMCWWFCFTYFITSGFGSVVRLHLYL